MAGVAGLFFVLVAVSTHRPLIALAGIPAFYAVEAQMVFLFPLALDRHPRVFRQSRRWTTRAGGTCSVMRVVIPLAATMIGGGFVGRGFVRSWSLGCLAVCIWYEDLRRDSCQEAAPAKLQSDARFQFGAFGPLHIRRERIELGLAKPIKLFYASDLHLGWRWSNPVVAQLVEAARFVAPDAIILGGDLADRHRAIGSVCYCAAALSRIAPVYAIAGNHDHRPGLDAVRLAVEASGATWFDGGCSRETVALRADLHLCATIEPSNAASPHRILCAHNPNVFPAASRAGYRLVLAGHLHGGQCVLAQTHGRLYPGAWFARWTGLRFTEGRTTMLVSRGAADTLPFRWNCPREVVVCEII
jgi:hypothetical protein